MKQGSAFLFIDDQLRLLPALPACSNSQLLLVPVQIAGPGFSRIFILQLLTLDRGCGAGFLNACKPDSVTAAGMFGHFQQFS